MNNKCEHQLRGNRQCSRSSVDDSWNRYCWQHQLEHLVEITADYWMWVEGSFPWIKERLGR